MTSEIVTYDSLDAYKEEVAGLVQQIKDKCDKLDIPFLAVFAVQNDEERTGYKVDGIMPGSKSPTGTKNMMALTDDKLASIFTELIGYNIPEEIDMPKMTDDDNFPDEI